MRYDPDDKKYYFNKEMIMSSEQKNAFDNFSNAWKMAALNDLSGTMKNSMKKTETGPVSAVLGIVAGLMLIVGFFGIICCLIMKKYDLILLILSVILALFGIFTLTGKTGDPDTFVENIVFLRIEGIIMLLGAPALVLAYTAHKLLPGLFIAFLTGFLVMTLKTIGFITAPRTVYKEEIRARCIGYIRKMVSSGDHTETPVNSPVFEYYFDGEKYLACYDSFTPGYDGKIQVDSDSYIRIDPKSPWRVMGRSNSYMSGPIAGTLVCLAATLVVLYFLLSGNMPQG